MWSGHRAACQYLSRQLGPRLVLESALMSASCLNMMWCGRNVPGLHVGNPDAFVLGLIRGSIEGMHRASCRQQPSTPSSLKPSTRACIGRRALDAGSPGNVIFHSIRGSGEMRWSARRQPRHQRPMRGLWKWIGRHATHPQPRHGHPRRGSWI
jgi:hypothetical protein